ncbi:MAG: helix-turn-helix transcriptional regulator [Acidobacteria bacterium]|nr:helix-turn-helix transcriptional regulator [Acidobacteriota bacterium]
MNTSQIRKIRLIRGWTQAEFAARLGIDRTTLSRVETSFVEAGPELQQRIAAALDWPVEILFPGWTKRGGE